MKKLLLTSLFSLGILTGSVAGFAQPPDFRGGDRDRGGDRERGDRDRGDRGDDRGGFRGGPPGGFPGGGFPGGGPPGGGFPGGGFPGGGGPPGGFSGGRGGFDPSSFIDRLDRNGNGMLDPDEMEGPAGFMISRLQREDPSIRTDRPIPLSKFKEAFDRARSGRESSDSGGGSDRGRDDTTERLNEAMTAPPLVPGFGEEAPVLPPVIGFGPSAELMSVEVTAADIKEAEERLGRYDRNKDGFLSGDELSSRWSGNPLDFDRNGDGKLSASELAVRAARMRVAQVEVSQAQTRRDSDRRGNRDSKPAEIPDPYKGRKSFAILARSLPEGMPGWFAEKDIDGDQQVSMAEYSKSWNESLVTEFQSFDLNGDGFVTPQECLAAVRDGASSSVTSGSGAMSDSSRSSRDATSTTASAPTTATPASGGTSSSTVGQPDQKTMDYVQRIIGRNDKNKDGQLTADEWKDMLVDPSAADTNKDGRITVLEYAQWTQSRQAR